MIKTIFLALALSSFAGAAAHAQCNQATTQNCSSTVYELSSVGMLKVNKWLEDSKKSPIKRMVFDFEKSTAVKVTAFRLDESVRTFYVDIKTFNFIVEKTGILPVDLIKLSRGV